MTREEIKEQYSMRDVLSRYGLVTNRAGMIHCPFHQGDRTPSMKIYKKDYHCFACGAHGDIFRFIQDMDGVSFRDAFESLGGTYNHDHKVNFALYHAEKLREMKQKERARKKARLKYLIKTFSSQIRFTKALLAISEPTSNFWCKCQQILVYERAELEELEELLYEDSNT